MIPQLGSGKESIYYVEKFWVPDDTNNNGLIEVYAEDGIPTFNTITTANIALIKLKTVISQQKWGSELQFMMKVIEKLIKFIFLFIQRLFTKP